MTEQTTITALDICDLGMQIDQMLSDGWKLHGTVMFDGRFRQAMTRETDEHPKQPRPANYRATVAFL